MRFLKRTLISVLVYAAVYLPFIAILQAITGYDFTAAYTIGGVSASVEMILCALIKREEQKVDKKSAEREQNEQQQD